MSINKKPPPRDIVVIGGSAGSIEALQALVRKLPGDFPASVFVVVHVPSGYSSTLPAILSRAGDLPAVHAKDGESVLPGRIYIAPPDHHLTLIDNKMKVERGPRENRHRPAIDPLFRTAARNFGPRVVGVILSGGFDDGSAGLLAVKGRGGTAVVQDPDDAGCRDMPASALRDAGAHYVVPRTELGPLLTKLVNVETAVMNASKNLPDEVPEENLKTETPEEGEGKPSPFACPECHGVLWEKQEGELLQFRCRVGHSYTAAALLEELPDSVESALWAAMRALEEKAALSRRVASRVRDQKRAVRVHEQAEADEQHAKMIRKILLSSREPKPDPLSESQSEPAA